MHNLSRYAWFTNELWYNLWVYIADYSVLFLPYRSSLGHAFSLFSIWSPGLAQEWWSDLMRVLLHLLTWSYSVLDYASTWSVMGGGLFAQRVYEGWGWKMDLPEINKWGMVAMEAGSGFVNWWGVSKTAGWIKWGRFSQTFLRKLVLQHRVRC